MKKKLFIILFFLMINQSYAQCAMCRAVVEQGGEDMAEGINSGIIYLMIFPYLVIGAGIFFLYRNWKKSKG
ncbi:MAG: hypothetical protein KAH72_07305 [Flavobacteriaceae bacterium]|nr:hypothetical protein [Flavobacteriaceae bacterium]